jgi:hypothetical protein
MVYFTATHGELPLSVSVKARRLISEFVSRGLVTVTSVDGDLYFFRDILTY